MDEKIAHFTLKESNGARKTVAKKHMDEIPILKEKFISQCPNKNFGEYVWETTMGPQMGYSFSRLHGLAYTYVGIQTLYLATNYPSIYWNCACLIINAGGADLLDADDVLDEENDNVKVKNKNVNYGKISSAISESMSKGIRVLPPDINKSDLIFIPDKDRNAIIYGMKGINRIGIQLVYDIFKNRPYTSIEDFLSKVKVNKIQMISLIKSGAFDSLYNNDRLKVMNEYLLQVSDQKKRITLQNMQMLISKDLIPMELRFECRLFNFNKYLKNFKKGSYYLLDSIAMRFYLNNFDDTKLEDIEINGEEQAAKIKQLTWDNIYKKGMNPVRDWMKANQQEILAALNKKLFDETFEKYAEGNLSKWEMDSLGFYYHDHELKSVHNDIYGIVDIRNLKEEPEIERSFTTKDGTEIKIFKVVRIAGTVIDKDKNHSSITLLTPTGTIVVKVWKNQFAAWDKQISERGVDGVKHVLEKSWFQRGTKLIVTGIKRGDNFIPKKYKNTEWPLFEKVIEIDDKGWITKSATERIEVEE